MSKIEFSIDQCGETYTPYWLKCICAGRAAEGLREDWRAQMETMQHEIGFDYIRFHGIFHEDMMVYREDKDGNPIYNWQYVDNLFDFLLEMEIRPLLELGFMPYAMASGEGTCFWWKGNSTPPKDHDKWAALVSELVRHCINRYGLSEVLQWYFEVWNEPDLYKGFWWGTKDDYFKLYDYSVRAIKAIHPDLRVGGPATSASHAKEPTWVADLLEHCAKNEVPIDFVSTHPYPNLWPLDGYGNSEMIYRDADSTLSDLIKVRAAVDNSAFPDAEIHLTEWNSSPSPRDLVHDTAFMAPFLVKNNIQGIGLVDSLGFWAFTDVFEEGRAGDTIFHGGFGLINAQGLKKSAYYGYWFLARLGSKKLLGGDDYFVTRTEDKVQILLWNYCHYTKAFEGGDFAALSYSNRYDIFEDQGDRAFEIAIPDLVGDYRVIEYTLDREHGSVYDAWLANGAPANPTEEELNILERKTGPVGQIAVLHEAQGYQKTVHVKPHGVTLIELQRLY